MLASEVVGMLERENPDISRMDLLEQVNFIHRMMVVGRSQLTLIKDSSTGGDYNFVAPSESFSLSDVIGIPIQFIDRFYIKDYACPLLDVESYDDDVYMPSKYVGKKLYVRAYRAIEDITSEMDELFVPDDSIDVLLMGVSAYLEKIEHGSMRTYVEWRDTVLKKWKWRLNKSYNWKGGI